MAGSGKFHISSSGVPVVCRAVKRPCPKGSVAMHYDSIGDAQVVADDLNSKLEVLSSEGRFGFAVNGEHRIPSSHAVNAVRQLNALKLNLLRLNKVFDQHKQALVGSMEASGGGTVRSGVADVTFVKGSLRSSVDTERLREAGLYDAFSKESTVREHVTLVTDDESRVLKNFHSRLESVDGDVGEFRVVDGKFTPGTVKSLERLRDFKAKIERAKELEREIKSRLMDEMKSAGVDRFTVDKISFEYNPESVRRVVDTGKLRSAQLYDDFSRKVDVKPTVRIKFA